jgi:hypothetical protein
VKYAKLMLALNQTNYLNNNMALQLSVLAASQKWTHFINNQLPLPGVISSSLCIPGHSQNELEKTGTPPSLVQTVLTNTSPHLPQPALPYHLSALLLPPNKNFFGISSSVVVSTFY